MTNLMKILLVGDDASIAPYHPLEPVSAKLAAIFGDEFELVSTDNYDAFADLKRSEFPICISYTDCWNRDLTASQTAGLLTFVAGGGNLIVLHSGISIQRSYELLQMVGAKFMHHPPFQTLSYYGIEEGHPLLEGVTNFSVDEEPYMFEFDPFTPKTVFLTYEFEGARYPAGWEHDYALGKIIYLQPGHHAPSFDPPAYRQLLLNSARWLAARRVE
ncbi:glycosyl hydrolase [Paenibacillus pectinilyticus]|uniref:Glycosyl hydrolase n=1 Tax=Paenibacillus pectinilyticus TaxID=512399 RepID=A0A1C1A6R8_9BACL|nr:ThuA domain-containing protein [Paenibacillus pectinilyticus]OCT16257.1 glycosyl hydrolase [Paenibacillus pectinilyticus]